MGFFERPDPRLFASADPTPIVAVARTVARQAIALSLALAVAAGLYVGNVAAGFHAAARVRGTILTSGLRDRVVVVRDRRDVPHIEAGNDRDLFFAQGYVEGSDRLFQLDLTRRFAYGRLAEVLGSKALPYDEEERAVDVAGIAERQLKALPSSDRETLVAFSDGVNAAALTQPLPVEFRMLLYRPEPWTPRDSLAVSIAASLQLADSWHDVFARDAVWRTYGARCFDALVPLSDARYDVTLDGVRQARPMPPISRVCAGSTLASRPVVRAIGSNAWAAGSRRTADRHALIANDPHLDATIPGIWYLVELDAPHLHAAGATIPGLPGVLLGHNERIAWASTNANMATTSIFEAGHLDRRSWVTAQIRVRLSRGVRIAYYRTPREFSVPDENDPSKIALVRWPIYAETRSAISTALALDRARNAGDALRILALYRGSPQNFIVADRSGAVAYHVAGLVPDDPAWGRYVHPARDLKASYAPLPFARLPALWPSRERIVVTANNRPYGSRYPDRLSPQFAPPYRAYRIAELLGARRRYDVGYFAGMQLDTLSPIDREIAHGAVRLMRTGSVPSNIAAAVALLARWDGSYRPQSRAAPLEHALRASVLEEGPAFNARLNVLRGRIDAALSLRQEIAGALAFFASGRQAIWRDAGAMRIEHLLAPLNFGFLGGAWLPGAGDEDTIHLQDSGIAQGFRAVWDVGDWNRGGISIPSGESGEPGSRHYTDLMRAWIAGALEPLPFGVAATRRNAANTLTLQPQPLAP